MTEYLTNSLMWIVILGPEKTVLENRNSEQNHNLKVTFDFLDSLYCHLVKKTMRYGLL